jgi:hypothetical protein
MMISSTLIQPLMGFLTFSIGMAFGGIINLKLLATENFYPNIHKYKWFYLLIYSQLCFEEWVKKYISEFLNNYGKNSIALTTLFIFNALC